MIGHKEKSVAFQQALLRSERFRILIVLYGAGAAFVVHTLRTGILHTRGNLRLWLATFLLVALFVGYKLLMLRAINHAIQIDQDIANKVSISDSIVESCLTALAVALLPSAGADAAFRPLANPAVLVFFVFIILSTLHLNPMTCRVSGMLAAASYLAAAAYLGWKPSLAIEEASLLSPQAAVLSYAITLAVAGFVAGAVASEIRKQVDVTLKGEERFRIFMDNSPAVVWIKDEQGRYVYANKPYLKQLGVRLEDRQGKTDFEIYPRAIAEQFRKNDQAALAAGHPIEVTEESVSPSGEQRFWLSYKFPFHETSGQLLVAGIGVDFTENKRLLSIRNELEIAREIQLSILPSSAPELDNLRISAAYYPMNHVAGDFYDFIPVDQQRAGILVADVMGHGVPAALVASMIKVALHSVVSFANDPSEVLRGLNRILSGQQHQLITAAYLWLDMETRKALYSAAGHPPLLRWRENKLEPIESNGLPIGLSPDSKYPVCEMTLNAGHRFLLYTDGVIDTKNAAGDDFGDRKLEEVVRNNHARTSSELSEQLLSEIRNWQPTGTTQQDDITFIIIDVV